MSVIEDKSSFIIAYRSPGSFYLNYFMYLSFAHNRLNYEKRGNTPTMPDPLTPITKQLHRYLQIHVKEAERRYLQSERQPPKYFINR
jgi:hypothetical protein